MFYQGCIFYIRSPAQGGGDGGNKKYVVGVKKNVKIKKTENIFSISPPSLVKKN